MSMKTKAFTLIELLIVVAIIAILAAIAVPNFLEAQVRSKVARCKTDMRSLATGLEAYRVDSTHYPPCFSYYKYDQDPSGTEVMATSPGSYCFPALDLFRLTTPVAYMTSIPDNVFQDTTPIFFADMEEAFGKIHRRFYWYHSDWWKRRMLGYAPGSVRNAILVACAASGIPVKEDGAQWALWSIGPDKVFSEGQWLMYGEGVVNAIPPIGPHSWGAIYDPTNGTMSLGDIVRIGP
jgi:prepilin-type N-terminal cleavage/methylation domain-containing protein